MRPHPLMCCDRSTLGQAGHELSDLGQADHDLSDLRRADHDLSNHLGQADHDLFDHLGQAYHDLTDLGQADHDLSNHRGQADHGLTNLQYVRQIAIMSDRGVPSCFPHLGVWQIDENPPRQSSEHSLVQIERPVGGGDHHHSVATGAKTVPLLFQQRGEKEKRQQRERKRAGRGSSVNSTNSCGTQTWRPAAETDKRGAAVAPLKCRLSIIVPAARYIAGDIAWHRRD